MAEPEIEIRGMKDVDLKGGIVFDSFPSSGLANAIASGCLIHPLKTEFVAVLDSPAFPALSVICNSAPNFPARVYANEELKLVFFVSKLKLDQSMYPPVANTMLQWAADSGFELVISTAGIPYEEGDGPKDDSPQVYAVGSTKRLSSGEKTPAFQPLAAAR